MCFDLMWVELYYCALVLFGRGAVAEVELVRI